MSTSLKRLEEACESIDASVFSGDLLWDKPRLDMLVEYVGRWSRAIVDHRKHVAEADKPLRSMTLKELDSEDDADSHEIDGMSE